MRKKQEVQVRTLNRWLSGVMAAAIMAGVAMTGAARIASAQESHWKDQAESDLSDAAAKDIAAGNGAKALEDLNAWKQKYPDSYYKNDRESMYAQAYQLSKDYDKLLDVAKQLMAENIDSLFPDPTNGPKRVLYVLFPAVTVINQIPNPTPDQIATAVKAANMLKDYNRKPQGVSDADWATLRKSMVAAAEGTLYALAIAPGLAADAKKDCAAGEVAWAKALGDYPAKTGISYQLGRALRCEKKYDEALYEFARAVAIDPSGGGTLNAKTVTDYLTNFYKNYHGDVDGLDQLEELAKASPMPPADFHIKTATEIAEAKEKEFETSHPDIALWMKLKATLTSDQGPQYFESSMKDAQVPELKGTVLESKCRVKELQVAIPLPDATGPLVPEITLKLDTALSGKAESGVITFAGVASAFSPTPFMLTMTIDKKDIKDLTVTPCAPVVPKKKKK
jgi:tetratricopeptide (TPR) repeat protein